MIRAIVEGLYWITTGAGVAAGLYAARVWWQSAKVTPDPFRDGVVESGESCSAQGQWLGELIRVGIETAALNSKAARWTACAIVLGALATLLDHIH